MLGQGERIASSELFTLLVVFVIGSAVIIPKGAIAGHDSWVAVIIATLVGACLMWVYSSVGRLYPDRSYLQVVQHTIGKWPAKLVGLLYVWYSYHLGTIVLKNLDELTVTVLLPQTPPLYIDVILMSLVVWAAYEGIEVVARCSIVIFGIYCIFTIITTLLLFQDIDFEHLLPILDHGWPPVLKASFNVTTFPFGETVLFMMIIPFLNNTGKIKKTSIWAMFIAGFFLLMDDLRNVLIFSEVTTNVLFPSYSAVSFISVADFLERIEPFGYLIWAFSGFIKISVCLHVCTFFLTQTFGIRNARLFLIPIAILMVELAQFIYHNQAEMLDFATDVWPWYSVPFQILIPFLVLLLARRKKKKEDREREEQQDDCLIA